MASAASIPLPAPAPGIVHHLPIVTSALGAAFLVILLAHVARRPGAVPVRWWAAGVACFGIGTVLEAAITLRGNSITLTRIWFLAGAVGTAYLLAQGTAWLLLPRAQARRVTMITLPIVAATGLLVLLSPGVAEAIEPHRPSGDVLAWQWIRWITPLINVYALVVLVGGAMLGAVRFLRRGGPGAAARASGNLLIAAGALGAGIGGTLAKTGRVEALYVAELVGLLLIAAGYVAVVHVAPRRSGGASAVG